MTSLCKNVMHIQNEIWINNKTEYFIYFTSLMVINVVYSFLKAKVFDSKTIRIAKGVFSYQSTTFIV